MVRREILAILRASDKGPKSPKLEKPCPPNLVSMHFTSTSTCMNFLSSFYFLTPMDLLNTWILLNGCNLVDGACFTPFLMISTYCSLFVLASSSLSFSLFIAEDKEDSERLGLVTLVLNCVRSILQYVNKVVKQTENRQKLQEYQSKLDSSPMERLTHQIAEKYKDLNLTSEGRVLLHEGVLTWKISHRKTVG